MTTSLLEVRGVSKRYPGVQALRDVSLRLERGEVLALIGENGAGKSTLMKILGGVAQTDTGTLWLDGQQVSVNSTRAATDLGISFIHQELNLADNLDVAANVFLGREPRRFGFLDHGAIHRGASAVLDRIGVDFEPSTPVATLSMGRQQMVEIAKALSTNARVLIMDEPTSSLSQHEADRLIEVVKDLRERGVGIIYITHRLAEVEELADRVTVLRDGENAGELQRTEIHHDAMVRLMVGRDVSQLFERTPRQGGETVLEVDGIASPEHPTSPVSFSVRAGEMVGIAGLVGAGRTELLGSIFGVSRRVRGEVRVGGRSLPVHNARAAIGAGLALVPEDRKQQGLFLELAVRSNVSIASLSRDATCGFVDARSERRVSVEMIDKLGVKTPHDRQEVQFLSGGNQQKVVLGKWLALSPRVLLLDEPTRGIDIGAKEEIYQLMHELTGQGVAVVFVSSEMEEILSLADRTLVMHEGRLAGELAKADLSEEAILHLATGGRGRASS